jgi:hypothetical protein
MGGLEQVPGDQDRRFPAVQQDLAVLAVHRIARGPRDHVGHGACQQLVPERECVFSCGHEPGAHRFLDRGQQRGRGFAEHFGGVFQPERAAEHRRCHEQVPGLLAESFEAPLRDAVNPPRQPARSQHGTAAGDVHGVVVAQAVDQFGEQQGVPGGTAGQGQQARARRRAERVREQARHRIITQRGQGDPGGTVLLQKAEQVVHVLLRCAGPGQDPRDRMPFQLPRQYPQGRQGSPAVPVQVIQAHQDRYCRSPLFQVRLYVADPPRGLIRQITTGIIGGGPGERLTQGCAQCEERDGPAQLVRCSRRQGKPLPRGFLGGLAQQQRLAHARLPLHQHHPAKPSLSTPQQVTEYLLLRLPSGYDLLAGRLHRRPDFPQAFR